MGLLVATAVGCLGDEALVTSAIHMVKVVTTVDTVIKGNLLSPSATNWSTKESTFFLPLLPSFMAEPEERGRLRERGGERERVREREGEVIHISR